MIQTDSARFARRRYGWLRRQAILTRPAEANRRLSNDLRLPQTLAVVGILLVEERYNQFAFPILQVEEILTVDKKDSKWFSGNTVYNHRGHTLPVTTLSSILDFPPSAFADDQVSLVILEQLTTAGEPNPSRLYQERCRYLLEHPPQDWDGIWTLTSK